MLFKGGVGDSKEGATKRSLDRTKWAPWHDLGVPKTHDVTRAHTHGLHDMCGVHHVAAMARGMVQPTPCPRRHEGT